jgi:hypothetical protein
VRLGHPEAASFHYIQPGTTTLFAALEVATGWVTETCTERQRRQEFGAFLKQVAAAYPRRPQGPDPRQPPHPCRPREMTVGLAMANREARHGTPERRQALAAKGRGERTGIESGSLVGFARSPARATR